MPHRGLGFHPAVTLPSAGMCGLPFPNALTPAAPYTLSTPMFGVGGNPVWPSASSAGLALTPHSQAHHASQSPGFPIILSLCSLHSPREGAFLRPLRPEACPFPGPGPGPGSGLKPPSVCIVCILQRRPFGCMKVSPGMRLPGGGPSGKCMVGFSNRKEERVEL